MLDDHREGDRRADGWQEGARAMRNLYLLDAYRLKSAAVLRIFGHFGNDEAGAFMVPFEGKIFKVIAVSGEGWDHVSVSLPDRTPTWQEMEHIKRLFFKDDEWAYQLHAPPSKHINIHPHVLHIWRPLLHPIVT